MVTQKPMTKSIEEQIREAEAKRNATAPAETKPDAPVSSKRRFRWDRLPTVLFGVLIFGVWWALGGRYTIDGSPLAGNEILSWFHAPQPFNPVADWHWYVYLCWLPVLISIVERSNRPRKGVAFYGILSIGFLVWLIVSGFDMGSTYLAITHPRADTYTIAKQIAANSKAAITWSVITTFAPEIALAELWRYLWNGDPMIVRIWKMFKRK